MTPAFRAQVIEGMMAPFAKLGRGAGTYDGFVWTH